MSELILDLKFKSEDLDKEVTIRQFFYELLKTFWEQQDEFSAKRPFGNSSYDSDLIKCLIENKLVEGRIDDDGYLEFYDNDKVNEFILNKIIKPIFNEQ